jgi:hypothetical protein
LWKYLTVLRRSKMFFVVQFELILKIGSIKCAYGGRQKNISRAPRWTGLVYTVSSEMVVRVSALCFGFRRLPPGRFLILISVRSWVNSKAIVRLERLGQLKNPLTSLGNDTATFWLVT